MRIDRQPSREVAAFGPTDFETEGASMEAGPAGPAEEGAPESQINIKGNAKDIQRFRHIAKRDGLRLIGLLRRATEAYERRGEAAHLAHRDELQSLER